MLYREDDGLYCRWLTDYNLATDSLITRFDATMQGPLHERGVNHVTTEIIQFALEFYERQIEDVKRRARENPAGHFMCDFHITYDEMARRRMRPERLGSQLRVRLPEDFRVREGPEIAYGHLHVRPEWLAGAIEPHERYAEAEKRSLELLKSWLSPAQRLEYDQHSYFTVQGSDTRTHYRLLSEHSYNIRELDEKGALTGQKFCVVPAQPVALGDQLLAQKIWLETDETRTLKIANKITRTGQSRGNLAAINQSTRDAVRLFTESNAFVQRNEFVEMMGEPENARGTGRTSRQLLGAPYGAAFVWCNNRVDYAVGLAHELGRDDIRVLPLYMLNEHYEGLRGHQYPAIIVDHAAELTEQGRAYLHQLTARLRGPRTIQEG